MMQESRIASATGTDRPPLGAVAAMAGCLIGLEIAITRIYAVVLWYHFAFLAISVCLFGLGVAGIAIQIAQDRLRPERTRVHLAVFALAFSVSAALAVVTMLQMRLGGLSFSTGVLGRLAVVFFLSSLPFFFIGCFLSLAVRRYHRSISRVYFADLAGASLGCLVVMAFLSFLGAPSAIVAFGAVAALVAVLLAWRSSAAVGRTGAALVAACVLLAWLGPNTPLLSVHYSKGNTEPDRLVERWNSFSRVIAFPRTWEEEGQRVHDIMIEIDGIAHTPITPFDGDPAKSWYHAFNLSALPYAIKPDANVLIFGSGGGEHILTALPFHPRHITGVEMNPIVVDLVRNRFADVSGGLFDRDDVTIAIDEGRSFLAHTDEKYDLIQFTLVDTWASTVAGGFVLTENNVFTVEAFEKYFDRLAPGGVISLKRWYEADGVSVKEHALRLVALARDVMAERGITTFTDKVFIAQYTEFVNVMFKPDGFSFDEVVRLLNFCRKNGFEIVYSPNYKMEKGEFHRLLEAPDLDAYLAAFPEHDLSPVTDDRPFFFYTLRPRDLAKVMSLSYAAKIRNIGPVILLGLLGIVTVAVLAFIFLPALLGRMHERTGGRRESLKFAAYFALIGAGFLLVEITLMQRFILFLGHPVYALAVILFSILLFGGIGSGLSGRFADDRLRGPVRGVIAALIAYALLLTFVAPHIFDALIGLPPAARIAIAVAMIAPVGLGLGVPFPVGMRILGATDEHLIPWMWAVNSAASVLGSVLAMVLAVHLGFSVTMIVGLVCYLAVILIV